MREYYFKVRKTGTRDTPTKVFGIRNVAAYKRQMKKNGYTVIWRLKRPRGVSQGRSGCRTNGSAPRAVARWSYGVSPMCGWC